MPGYISEYDHYGNSPEFIELAIPAGTDVAGYQVVIYGSDGFVDHTIDLPDLTVQNTMGGQDVYLIESGTPGFSGIDPGDSTALIDDSGTVLQFITHNRTTTAQNGPAVGETSTHIGNASGAGNSLQSDDGGQSYYVQNSTNPGTVPCFAPGTLISTAQGPRAVETLRPGDLVLTLDNGLQEILWVRSGDQALEDLDVDAKPVLIPAGSLGPGRPARDLIVSPQHRILVGGQDQIKGVFTNEGFAPAKSLTGLPRIHRMQGETSITWVHFACACHEVVFANGCATESLLLGPMVVNGLNKFERQEVIRIFGPPETGEDGLNGPPVRDCLTVQAARRAIKSHKHSREKADGVRKRDLHEAIKRHEMHKQGDLHRVEAARHL